MRLLAKLRTRWRALVSPASVERDLADELDFHLQQQSDAYRSQGLTASDARAAAHRDFGPTDLAAERCRDARGVRLWLDAVRDARFGWRAARRAPGTMAAAVATLALGIGTATAMFSVVDAVLLRPLSFADPERLVRADQYVAPGALAIYEQQAQAFDGVGIFRTNVEANLLLGTSPERVRATFVSAHLLPMLGVHPLAGRTFRS
ncbi:MAG TPA: permease prefix domain 1-containing protein, partial [Luteitalea sp.]|nr:permease prefix domain 1-containing protein [Luteitalea sp.]